MSAKSVAVSGTERASCSEQLALEMLLLVTEVMVDDVSLAEQMRGSIMTIWLAERRTGHPDFAWIAWRDIQCGERRLRQQLYRALRRGYVERGRFDQAMALLTRNAQHRLACLQPVEQLTLM